MQGNRKFSAGITSERAITFVKKGYTSIHFCGAPSARCCKFEKKIVIQQYNHPAKFYRAGSKLRFHDLDEIRLQRREGTRTVIFLDSEGSTYSMCIFVDVNKFLMSFVLSAQTSTLLAYRYQRVNKPARAQAVI